MSLGSLRIQVEKCHEILTYLVQVPLDEISDGTDGIINYIRRIKNAKSDFSYYSQNLSSSLLKNGSVDNARLVREERHELLNEVSEFIKFANVELKQNNIDVLSNIEVYSTVSNLESTSGADLPPISEIVGNEYLELQSRVDNIQFSSVTEPIVTSGSPVPNAIVVDPTVAPLNSDVAPLDISLPSVSGIQISKPVDNLNIEPSHQVSMFMPVEPNVSVLNSANLGHIDNLSSSEGNSLNSRNMQLCSVASGSSMVPGYVRIEPDAPNLF